MKIERRDGLTYLEILIVLVILSILGIIVQIFLFSSTQTARSLAGVVIGETYSKCTNDEKEKIAEELARELGEKWRNAQPGDLVQFDYNNNGHIYLIKDLREDSMLLYFGTRETPSWIHFGRISDSDALFTNGDPLFRQKLRERVMQVQEIENEKRDG